MFSWSANSNSLVIVMDVNIPLNPATIPHAATTTTFKNPSLNHSIAVILGLNITILAYFYGPLNISIVDPVNISSSHISGAHKTNVVC